ncbi:hypothetical protein BN14_03322 [Rhizoctonia solani AG-1 IB]|uniref:Uncharacterized protein n=1 Tax=Thanatephorus cucumeris (strain AG1-IB / isolate 7/3/14) TaxID=1108050 RepID=M5BNQ0_THACB|nr:hypothetical protein BN14_03322 [Rhizoctonia solani AG-1 IB]
MGPEISSAGSILDDSTGSRDTSDDEHDNEAPGPLGSTLRDSPVGIDLNSPLDTAIGWLSSDEKIYNVLNLEGELDLVAHSDEKPHGLKVATLGYVSSSSARTPFELLSERETGGIVFLTPLEPATDQMGGDLDSSTNFANHSTAMLMARAAPLGLDLLSNLNLTGDSLSASEIGHPAPSSFINVLIKTGNPSSNSNPGSSLCATFYSHSSANRTNDDPPMFLEKCDHSFISGGHDNTATQLWQYDPKTHELKPVLQGTSSDSARLNAPPNSPVSSSLTGAGPGTGIPQPSESRPPVEETRTSDIQTSATARHLKNDAPSGTTRTHSSQTVAPSQIRVRRGKSDLMEGNESMPQTPKVVVAVDPYTLVFVPRSATEALPDSPV